MYHYKCIIANIFKYDTQVSIEMTYFYKNKCLSIVYFKCLSVHLEVHFNHISKTRETIMKLYEKQLQI